MIVGPVDVVVAPDYRIANPYQDLLASALHPRFALAYGEVGEARTCLRHKAAREPVLFHLHWEDHVHKQAVDEADAGSRVDAFLDELEGFVADGGGLIWTVHNLEPHATRFPDAQRRLVEAVGGLAHRVTAHAAWLLPLIARRGVGEEKLALVPHGNYDGAFGIRAKRDAARAALELEPEARLGLFFGRLDAYKGVERLLTAFAQAGAPELLLAIVGKPVQPLDAALATLPPPLRARLRYHPGFVPADRLALWVAAADAAILPYERITTSGSTMLALTFSLPVIGPDLPGIADLVRDGREGMLFEPNRTRSLAAALERFAACPRAELEAMRIAARRRAEMYPSATSGGMMSALYTDVAATVGARRRPVRF